MRLLSSGSFDNDGLGLRMLGEFTRPASI